MAKKRLKIDELAKLRQFRKGDDVDDFLSTQFRQVVRAIEQAYVKTDDSSTNSPTDLSAYSTTAQMNAAIAAAISSTNPVWAAFNPSTISSSGNIVISSGRGNAGFTPDGVQFRPYNYGLYWFDLNVYWTRIAPPSDGTYTSTLRAITVDGPVIDTMTFEHFQAGFSGGISINQTQMGFYTIIGSTSGVRLNLTLSNAVISKFNVKITRIADDF